MRKAVVTFVLLSITVLVYLNSFPATFHFDDFALMLENPLVTSPQFDYSSLWQLYGGRPLTFWTYWANYQAFGPDASSFHLVSLLLHALAVVLIFHLLVIWTGEEYPAFLASLVFAVHPLQAQAVNYVWSRSMLLMAVFGMTALLAIRKLPWVAVLCLQLAILSRVEALVLMIPMLYLRPRLYKPLALMFVANLVAVVGFLWQHSPQETAWTHPDILNYWLGAAAAFWKYLGMMFWPQGFTIDHQITSPTLVPGTLALLVLGTLVFVGLRLLRQRSWPGLALLWVVLLLLPAMLVPNSDLFNESRAYLSLAGFAASIGWLGAKLTGAESHNRQPRRLAAACLTLALMTLWVPATVARNMVWKDDIALWQEATLLYPENQRAYYNLGVGLARSGHRDRAKDALQKALRLNPEDPFTYAALGFCAEKQGQVEQARILYRQACFLDPANEYARQGLYRLREGPEGRTF